MAGSISLSLSQQFDKLGRPLANGLLYFIQAGTTSTPQSAYYDTSLTLPLPNPVTLDASGRIPAFYLADGQIKVRLTDKYGVAQLEQDNLLVIGPSSGGGGGGGSVDPTTIFQTGDVMWLDVQGPRTGWVRDNGRTIGSAISGATERANADVAALFSFLWTNYSNTICPVSTGRGASAAADFAANKTITLPNKRNIVPGGLDDMGNSAAGGYTGVPVVSGDVTTAGSVIGESTHVTTQAELPNVSFAVAIPSGQGSHAHAVTGGVKGGTTDGTSSGPSQAAPIGSATITISNATLPSMTGTAASGGSGTAHNNVQRTVLGTYYRKL